MKTLPLKLDKVISPDAGPYFVATDTAGITRVARVLRGWDGIKQDYADVPGLTVWSSQTEPDSAEAQHARVCVVMRNTGLAGLYAESYA